MNMDPGSNIPATCPGILQRENGMLQLTENVHVPTLEPGWLLVRTAAVSLSHCDFKIPELLPTPGLKAGVDFAGTVAARGQDVTGFQLGDRVIGAVVGNNQDDPESGAFSQYVKIEAIFAFRAPEHMSFEMALALNPAYMCTAALSLHQGLGLPAVLDEAMPHRIQPGQLGGRDTVLVNGGASCIGLVTIQMLKIHGYHVVTTCSKRNFDLVKEYGADEAFDYHMPKCATMIKDYTKDRLRYTIDPFGKPDTTSLCLGALGRRGGIYCSLEHYQHDMLRSRRTVKHCLIMGPAVSGRGVNLPEPYGVVRDSVLEEWATNICYPGIQREIDIGGLKPLPFRLLEGGWEGIIPGLDALRNTGVSGQKLIVIVN